MENEKHPCLLPNWMHSYISKDLAGFCDEITSYWTTYGGLSALIRSPAFLAAIALNFISYPLWSSKLAPTIALSIIPNLFVFTIIGMAIITAFPNNILLKVLTEGGRKDSFYMDLSSKFVHFIFVQVICLIVSLIAKSFDTACLAFFSSFLLLYALLCVAMAALALFGLAQIHNHPGSSEIKSNNNDEIV
jgi:hypothetical protein